MPKLFNYEDLKVKRQEVIKWYNSEFTGLDTYNYKRKWDGIWLVTKATLHY